MKLLGKSWKYISEGNVHIVVQLKDTNYVLRLIKEDGKPVLKEHVKNSLNFVNYIMLPLLQDSQDCIGEVIEIPHSSLTELSRELQQFRPKKRLNKTVLSPFAIKTANLTIVSSQCKSPAYCVEIKPKEGFISSGVRTHSKCYYCLKQHLKVHNKDIKQISAYCPLDLFSGDRKRMKQAIESLILNPQNNIKIFKNGMMINHDKLHHEVDDFLGSLFGNKNVLADFIVAVLLYEKDSPSVVITESKIISQSLPEEGTTPCDESNNLKPDSLLYKLLQLQKLSENTMLNNIFVTEQYNNYVAIMNELLETEKLDLRVEKDRNMFFESVSPVHKSLISAIAKDCSIMISFSTEYIMDVPYIDIQDFNNKITRVYFKIAVTDLEPKPISTLLKRKYTEKKILETYEKHILSLNKKSE